MYTTVPYAQNMMSDKSSNLATKVTECSHFNSSESGFVYGLGQPGHLILLERHNLSHSISDIMYLCTHFGLVSYMYCKKCPIYILMGREGILSNEIV